MRKKLLASYLVILAITILITAILSWNQVKDYFYEQVFRESETQIKLIQEILVLESEHSDFNLQIFADQYSNETELRITLIDMEGVVLADSEVDPSTMENHKNRPEVKEALLGRGESSLRYSNSVGSYLFYYAVPIDATNFKGVLRISLPSVDIQKLIWDMTNSIFLAMFIGVILSLIMAYFFTRWFMQPIDELTKTAKLIADGAYEMKAYVDDQDQIGELAKAFNTMTYKMHKSIFDIASKNAELEAILKSMDIGLVAIDENYRIILCNQAFHQILSIEEEVVGKIFYEVSRNTQLFEVIEKSIDNDDFATHESKIIENGFEKQIKISATPIKNKGRRNLAEGVLILIEDVTNLRKLENIRRDFVSNVTHELKTPLTSIKGFVEALQSGAIKEVQTATRFLEIIDIETERLTTLIDDILTLSEIETMGVEKSKEFYPISEIVHEVIEILDISLKEKKLELRLDIQKDLEPYLCHKNRIKQLLINLVDNSIKYTESGYILIECKQSVDKKFLKINISDTGIGIEEKHFERLFERFYRVDKGRSRKQGGTGLGLSIVKHIVELYQGTIRVKSVFGKGTTFEVRLPY